MYDRRLAYYKYRPSVSLPKRPGPIQCVRNCPKCIIEEPVQDSSADRNAEEIIAITSYDDLTLRSKKVRNSSRFQTVQYHPGQVEILRRSLQAEPANKHVFIVAVTSISDLMYLEMLFDHEKIFSASSQSMINGATDNVQLENPNEIVLLAVRMPSCHSTRADHEDVLLLGYRSLTNCFGKFLSKMVDFSQDCSLVPVFICKEHDDRPYFRLGSLVIQIHEPYSLLKYHQQASLRNDKATSEDLATHLFYDLARHAPKLPSHLVAFVLLHALYDVVKQDLVEYMIWFRKVSMELNLQFAFIGDPEKAVEFALLVLKSYILIGSDQAIRVTQPDAIEAYARTVVPNLVLYGVLSRSILMLHNQDEKNVLLSKFDSLQRVRVMQDDLLKVSEYWAERIDPSIQFRRPCMTLQDSIFETYTSMNTFGKYFIIEEPRVGQTKAGYGWAGDYDSDEEYYQSKQNDPAFKTWISLSQDESKLDKLNLFMNSIQPYIVF